MCCIKPCPYCPQILVGLHGLRGLTCCCHKGLAIAVIAMAVQGVLGLLGTVMGFAMLAKLLAATLFRDLTSWAPRCLALWISLGFRPGCSRDTLCLELLVCFSTMTCSIASRSGSNACVASRTVVWLMLYWFCHVIGTDASMIAARSALPKGTFTFPFFIINTPWGCPSMWGGV
jgi:hypothetical protein